MVDTSVYYASLGRAVRYCTPSFESGRGSNRVSMVPTLASKIKSLLKIQNPDCVAYDLTFGCPGWVEGLIHSHAFIKSGNATRCLVIGTETLSRVIDNHDRDSMIFRDVLEQ